jgi:hypothetical protein
MTTFIEITRAALEALERSETAALDEMGLQPQMAQTGQVMNPG